jgi:hypothetical protein
MAILITRILQQPADLLRIAPVVCYYRITPAALPAASINFCSIINTAD